VVAAFGYAFGRDGDPGFFHGEDDEGLDAPPEGR
jgi:hypothetical protein